MHCIVNLNKYKTETVFGVPVSCCLPEHALEMINANIKGQRERKYISITNTESMYFARRMESHLEYIQKAAFSFCDGIGVMIAAMAEGKRVWRLNGPVLLDQCCEYGVRHRWRHFFCGGKEGVADLLSQKLTKRFPGLITAGTFCPPFRSLTPAEEQEMIRQINDARPDILWVGLGLLKQEAWIARYINQLNVPWSVGVGAAFDYHAGTVRWAPQRIRRIGMEWLYRLCWEPRMFGRNVRSYIFMFEAIWHGLKTRFRRMSVTVMRWVLLTSCDAARGSVLEKKSVDRARDIEM
jgi:N-acetylglucosaminyldiphosphoundecaprenol N-acetyl-beta-D-mannosaminyltransferase